MLAAVSEFLISQLISTPLSHCKRDRSYNTSFTCGDTEPETRRCCVTIIMMLTKEFTYNYNLNTDWLQEMITY